MKKIIIILLALLMFFILCACDVLELSAPVDTDSTETTGEKTSTESEETTKGEEETTTQTRLWHTECEYCGKLEGERRWFIARVTDNLMIDPVGSECFEAKSAMGAGIALHYSEVDGDPDAKLKAGHIIKVEYNGMIMESYPVQIGADKVTTVEEDSSDCTKFEYSGEMVIETLFLSSTEVTTESQLILDLLNNGKWIDDLGECINDYTISLNGKVLCYSSFCGTFNNITDGTSLNISDDEKASVNKYLESLFEGIDPSEE